MRNTDPYIAIGIPENRDVILKGMFWGFLRFLSSVKHRVIILGNDDDCMIPGKTSYIDSMRNKIVKRAQEKSCTHLLFVDSDTIPPPGALEKLLEADKDIVGGVYRFRVPPYRVLAFWYCAGHYVPMDELPGNQLIEVDGVGMGCTLIKMSTFKKLRKPYYRAGYYHKQSPYAFKFKNLPQKTKKRYLGEDIFFCERASEAGFKIFLHTGIRCDHITQMLIPGALKTPEIDWIKDLKENKVSLIFGGNHERKS